jgi:hypothetical protein
MYKYTIIQGVYLERLQIKKTTFYKTVFHFLYEWRFRRAGSLLLLHRFWEDWIAAFDFGGLINFINYGYFIQAAYQISVACEGFPSW